MSPVDRETLGWKRGMNSLCSRPFCKSSSATSEADDPESLAPPGTLNRDRQAESCSWVKGLWMGLYEWKNGGKKIAEFLPLDLNNDGFMTVEEFYRKRKEDSGSSTSLAGDFGRRPGMGMMATGISRGEFGSGVGSPGMNRSDLSVRGQNGMPGMYGSGNNGRSDRGSDRGGDRGPGGPGTGFPGMGRGPGSGESSGTPGTTPPSRFGPGAGTPGSTPGALTPPSGYGGERGGRGNRGPGGGEGDGASGGPKGDRKR